MTNVAETNPSAAKALLNPDRASKKVDGKAFILTDGLSVHFWHLTQVSWRAASGRTVPCYQGIEFLYPQLAVYTSNYCIICSPSTCLE